MKGYSDKVGFEIKNICDQLIRKFHPEKIILFGSSVSGNFTEDSDLDFLMIKKDISNNILERSRLVRRAIEKDIACDVFVFKPSEIQERQQLHDPFIEDILNSGKVLYG